MSRYEDIPSEVRAMLPSACDDVLTPEEAARLEAACDDDARVRLLVDYLQLDADLSILMQGDEALARSLKMVHSGLGKADGHSAPEATTGVSLPFLGTLGDTSHTDTGYFLQVGPLSYLIATFIMLVMGIAAWAWKLPDHTQVVRQSAPLHSPLSTLPAFVGRITGMVDCQWADPNTAVPGPVAVPLGRKYALASGLMEITYDTGAKVILQGPCTYEVESRAGGFLSLGKLTARVKKNEERRTKNEELSASRSSFLIPHSYFAVRTPTATVTDLGTEFGVEVSTEGTTTSHVFQGVIEVQPANDGDGLRGSAIRLTENESVQVERRQGDKGITVRLAAVDPAGFVRSEQLVKVAQETREKQKLEPFHRWQAYSQELRRDPSLVAYYDFQLDDGRPTVLGNVAANGDRSRDGVIENAIWTTGRMPGKQALRFGGSGNCVRVNLPKTMDDLTLAAWVFVEAFEDHYGDAFGYGGLLMTDRWNDSPGAVHWHVRSDGRVIFGIANGCYLPDLARVFDLNHRLQWRHIAIVYDHGIARARFCVDGQMTDEAPVETHVPICFGLASIGLWTGQQNRNLHGKLDELAIFSRPLKSEEILRMYDAGRK